MMQSNSLPRFIAVEVGNTRLTAPLHMELQQQLYALMAACDKTKLQLDETLVKAWKAAIDVELEINKVESASLITKRLSELDDVRDKYITHFFGMLRQLQQSPVKAQKENAEKVYYALQNYAGIQSESYDTETAHIDGLLHDVEKFATEVAALNLADTITELKGVHKTFKELSLQRVGDAVATDLPTSKKARAISDEAFDLVRRNLEANYWHPANESDKSVMYELAKRMNKLSADYASRKKAGDALSKTAEADRTREINEKLAPMYAHLEEANNLPANSLSFTGRTKEKGVNQQYELAVANREEAFWVRLREGHLVVVKKARQGAPKNGKSRSKNSPSEAKNHGTSTVKPKTTTNESPSAGSMGEATVTPKG